MKNICQRFQHQANIFQRFPEGKFIDVYWSRDRYSTQKITNKLMCRLGLLGDIHIHNRPSVSGCWFEYVEQSNGLTYFTQALQLGDVCILRTSPHYRAPVWVQMYCKLLMYRSILIHVKFYTKLADVWTSKLFALFSIESWNCTFLFNSLDIGVENY